MAANNTERVEYTMTWFIENYSYCWHKNAEELLSPEFYARGLEGTVWFLDLYPRGGRVDRMGSISIFLGRSKADDGPESIPLNYEISFLGSDGSVLHTRKTKYTFKKGGNWGFFAFLRMKDVVLYQRADFLPQDTLTVHCKMWMENGNIFKLESGFARTRIEIQQISFLHIVDSFSVLQPNQMTTLDISLSTKNDCLTSNIYLADSLCCDGTLIMKMKPYDTKKIISKCRIFLLDAAGNVQNCGEEDNRFDDTRKDVERVSLSLTRKAILENKHEYLLDDRLTLLCECTFSTGEKHEKIERIVHEIPSDALKQMNNDSSELSAYPSVLDDIKSLYDTQFLSDVELKTKSMSFRAHKNLLCARSSVFNAMLSHDMKEKNTDTILVDDLENDIVESFLRFLYSDEIKTDQWDSLIQLYYAADKYAVNKLKAMCSSILIKNLDVSNVIEILLLADTHNDSYLKKVVHDFILKHEEEVYSSDDWGNLIETNPVLVSYVMRLKYVQNN